MLRKFDFAVTNAWKGQVPETVSVHTDGRTSCSANYTMGEHLLVYAWERSGRLHSDACSRSVSLRYAFWDLQVLGDAAGRNGASSITAPTTNDLLLRLRGEREAAFAAAQALAHRFDQRDRIIREFVKVLRGRTRGDGEAAAFGLGTMGPSAHVAERDLVWAMHRAAPPVRASALSALRAVAGRERYPAFVQEALRSNQAPLLHVALRELRVGYSDSAFRVRAGKRLLELVLHRDEHVRSVAVDEIAENFPEQEDRLRLALLHLQRRLDSRTRAQARRLLEHLEARSH